MQQVVGSQLEVDTDQLGVLIADFADQARLGTEGMVDVAEDAQFIVILAVDVVERGEDDDDIRGEVVVGVEEGV